MGDVVEKGDSDFDLSVDGPFEGSDLLHLCLAPGDDGVEWSDDLADRCGGVVVGGKELDESGGGDSRHG